MDEGKNELEEQASALLLAELEESRLAIPYPGDAFRKAAIRAIVKALSTTLEPTPSKG